MTLFERIKKRTIINGNGCWIWQGHKMPTPFDYGQISVNKKCCLVHRIMWILFNGPIPEDKNVCHTCDTPSCCNHTHLFLGTDLENMQDAVKKGRVHRGENHSSSKFKEIDIINIRKDPRKHYVIAEEYDVSRQYITGIKSRKIWAWL